MNPIRLKKNNPIASEKHILELSLEIELNPNKTMTLKKKYKQKLKNIYLFLQCLSKRADNFKRLFL